MGRFAGLALAVLLAACQAPKPTLDPAAEPIARAFFAEVRDGGDLDADPHLAHELKNPTSEEQLTFFRAMIPLAPARTIELKTWDAKTDNVGTTTRLTQAYHYADRTLIVQTALFKSPGGHDPIIVGFNLTTAPPADDS
jgi:hypothetical protein